MCEAVHNLRFETQVQIKVTLTVVLLVVVVLKMISVGKDICDKQQQCISDGIKDMEFFLHDASEAKYTHWSSFRESSPHLNFVWVLDCGIQLGRHALFTEGHFAVTF